MSEYALLYYPDFQPDPVWLKKVLLLADRVTRIVPTDVKLDDPDELLRLQSHVPDCLSSLAPREDDIALDSQNLPRLKKAFAHLGQSNDVGRARNVTIQISGGTVSFEGHTFLHASKVSPEIEEALRRNGLMLEASLNDFADRGFFIVNETASDLILCGIAERMSRRTGLDAITDKPLPFALGALNGLDIEPRDNLNGVEGALLSSLARMLIPSEVAVLAPDKYGELREAYGSIRATFKELTATLSRVNRLDNIGDADELRNQIDGTAREFLHEYERFRKTRHAAIFRDWMPFCVGGVLSVAAAAVDPRYAVGIIGASVVFGAIDRVRQSQDSDHGRNKVFSMLTGLSDDIVEQSGILHII
ncbi:MAG: hypothetical protein ABSD98_10465 [Candidatus Korobacteraceae bacterium]|jgi:hypothetical protein